MKFEKKGLIYCPSGEHWWEKDSFLTPTALQIEKDIIRIWGGVRDTYGVSRIKYIDVSAQNPQKLLYVSDKVILDVGNAGCFDDNGMILGDVVRVENKLYMYYVGFQHVDNIKFCAFSGLAISNDMGKTFSRYSEVPVLDRSSRGRFGRCIHNVIYKDGIFRVYYTIINGWKKIGEKSYPQYNIWYIESEDGIHFSGEDNCLCVDVNENEYRIGKPRVYETDSGYEMLYTSDLLSKEYIIGNAKSLDGKHWERNDDVIGLNKSSSGWDSEMACYAMLLKTQYSTYAFYSGNDMGRTGVGYAVLKE